MGRIGRWLADEIAAEQDRLFLWVPVMFGLGVAAYFWLPAEPELWPLALAAIGAVIAARLLRETLTGQVLAGALAAGLCGLVAAKAASELARAPVIGREARNVALTGWVEQTESRIDGGQRLIVRVHEIASFSAAETPRRVRVRVPKGGERLRPGDGIRIDASLWPPAGPALPGAHDFARAAWFQSLGGVGLARRPPVLHNLEAPVPIALRVWGPVERLRQEISRRIAQALPGETGAIAVALVTGERGAISEVTNQAYRDSGLFHILSISGLHMTVFAGALYVSIRVLLSLLPAVALRYDIKKWAAIGGLLGTTGYMMISGGSPPAVRSALMIAVMFLAVLLERPALALRNVAVAALVILVLVPSSLIDVGFQMSFAAVTSLIAGVEAWRQWRQGAAMARPERVERGLLALAADFLGMISLTTVIATVAVAPFSIYYFHKTNQYGLIANIAAVPICNLLVMPAALAALIALPLGLETYPLAVMGAGIDAMTWIAQRVAALAGAVTEIPAISTAAFACMVTGGLWLCLWSTRARLLGLVPVAIGIGLAPFREPAHIIVGGDEPAIAVRAADGRLVTRPGRRGAFEIARWLEHEGDARTPAEAGKGPEFACDETGCVTEVARRKVAIVTKPAALREDCRTAAVVIWLGPGEADCPVTMPAKPIQISRAAVLVYGTHVVTFRADGVRMTTVAAARGRRPWVRHHPSEGERND